MPDLNSQVLDYVAHPNYHPVKPGVIAKKLGLDADGTHELKKVVKRLVKQGQLAFGPSHLVYPAGKGPAQKKAAKTAEAKAAAKASFNDALDQAKTKKRPKDDSAKRPADGRPTSRAAEAEAAPTKEGRKPKGHFVGTFRRAAGGFGFVRPEGTQRAEGRDADIFIPMDKTGDAASGDIVSVRLESRRGRMGKQEGRIIDVVERATNRFVGVYFEQAGMGMVQIDGKLFTSPIYVGDPGAKACGPMTRSSSKWSASRRTCAMAKA